MYANLSAEPAGGAAAPRGGQGRHSAGCGATGARPAAVHVIVTGIYIPGPGRCAVRGRTMCTTTLVRPSAASASAVKSSVYRRAGPGLKLRFFQVDTATGCSRLLYGRLSNDPTSVPVTTSCRILLYVIHLSSSLCAYSCKRLLSHC
jgi:hypothetical protein